MKDDKVIEEASKHYQAFMDTLGIPMDENSKDTAMRVAKMFYNELCATLRSDPPQMTFFPKDGYDEYIVVKDIPYTSICAHHHVAFYGKAHVAYHPKDRIVGISKLARVVTHFAAKPQIQEILTTEILEYLWEALDPVGIMVRVEGMHLCMVSRGAKATGSTTVTQQVKGTIDKDEVAALFN